MNKMKYLQRAALLATLMAGTLHATTLATRGSIIVTTDDFASHHYMQAPPKVEALRWSPREIESTINEVLVPRAYNSDRALRLDLSPEEQAYAALIVERAPLNAALNIVERRARAQFDANSPLIITRAKELWALDTKEFYSEVTADFTQIFFDVGKRSFDDVTSRINAATKELSDGKSFDELVQKYSDDANVVTNKGLIQGLQYGRTDPVIGRLIFTKLKEGEISSPVPSKIGLHIVRLDRKTVRTKRPFEDVQKQISEKLLEDAAKAARVALIEKLQTSGEVVIDSVAFEAFLKKDDPSLEGKRRALYKEMDTPASEPVSTGQPK